MNRIISDENGTKLEYDSLPDLFADLSHLGLCRERNERCRLYFGTDK